MVYRINTIVPALRSAKETICSFLHCHTAVLKAKSLFLRWYLVTKVAWAVLSVLFISRNPYIPFAWLLISINLVDVFNYPFILIYEK